MSLADQIEAGLGVPFSTSHGYRVIIALGDRVVRVHVYYDIENGRTFMEGSCGFPCTPATADALAMQLCNAINDKIRSLQ